VRGMTRRGKKGEGWRGRGWKKGHVETPTSDRVGWREGGLGCWGGLGGGESGVWRSREPGRGGERGGGREDAW